LARFQLPKGTQGIDKLPETNQLLQNLFHTHDASNSIISRFGIDGISVPGGTCRGGFNWNGSLYYVYSQELRRIDNVDTGAFTIIVGDIAGDDLVFSAEGAVTIAIVARGSASYTLDKFDTLVDTSGNANFVPFVSVASINGRAVYVPVSGDKVVFSDVGAFGTIQALSFFTPEQRPDDVVFCFTLDNNLYLMGTQSIERYKNVPTDAVFVRSGSAFDFGYIGGFLEVDEAVIFVGRKRKQSPGIFIMDANRVVKISNPPIDKILSTYTDQELSETVSGRINQLGFDIATLTFRRDSLLFFGGDWSLLDTVIDELSKPWSGGFIVEFDNRYYSGFEDKLGFFDDVNFDYGDRITRIIETSLQEENMEYMTGAELELGVSQGFNEGERGAVGLQTTEDGVLYGPIIYEDLGLVGQYAQKLVWNPPGGLGTYEGFMGIRLITRENVVFNADHLIIRGRPPTIGQIK